MKYLIILTDGMADRKIAALGGKTPLQYARTPYMDKIAATATIGTVLTVPVHMTPASDVANLSLMGYDPNEYYRGRSPLEAVSMGISLEDTDMTFRCNLVTLSDEEAYEEKVMLDYSGGDIDTEEATVLINDLQQALGDDSKNFFAGMNYRHILVWKNALGKNFRLQPPHDIYNQRITEYLPGVKLNDADNLLLRDLMIKSHDILKKHKLNQARINRGLAPANSLWIWGEGYKPSLDNFADKYGLQKTAMVAAVDLLKGLGICSGMDIIPVEGATGKIVTNFAGKITAALGALKSGYDLVYLHIESTDEAGHQGVVADKVWSIEQIDRLVISQVWQQLPDFPALRVLITPDHPTPVELRKHTPEAVPFMIFDKNHPVANGVGQYDEDMAKKGLHIEPGHKLMDFFIHGNQP